MNKVIRVIRLSLLQVRIRVKWAWLFPYQVEEL